MPALVGILSLLNNFYLITQITAACARFNKTGWKHLSSSLQELIMTKDLVALCHKKSTVEGYNEDKVSDMNTLVDSQ